MRGEPIRVRRARLVPVLLTRSGASTPPRTPAGSVTETMKEFAGQAEHLVDSYERRTSETSPFLPGHTGSGFPPDGSGGGDPERAPGRRAGRSPFTLPRSIVDFETQKRRRRDAAARTAGHRCAGPAAARRRGRAGPLGARRDDDRPARPQPLPLRRRAGADRPGLAPGRGGFRAVRAHPGAGRGGGPRVRHRRAGRGAGGPGGGLCQAPAAAVRGGRVGLVRHGHRACRAPGLRRTRRGPGRRRGPAPPDDDLGPGGRRPGRGARPARLGPGHARLGALAHRPADRGFQGGGPGPARRDLRPAGRRAPGRRPQRQARPAPGAAGRHDLLALPGALLGACPAGRARCARDGAVGLAAGRGGGRGRLARAAHGPAPGRHPADSGRARPPGGGPHGAAPARPGGPGTGADGRRARRDRRPAAGGRAGAAARARGGPALAGRGGPGGVGGRGDRGRSGGPVPAGGGAGRPAGDRPRAVRPHRRGAHRRRGGRPGAAARRAGRRGRPRGRGDRAARRRPAAGGARAAGGGPGRRRAAHPRRQRGRALGGGPARRPGGGPACPPGGGGPARPGLRGRPPGAGQPRPAAPLRPGRRAPRLHGPAAGPAEGLRPPAPGGADPDPGGVPGLRRLLDALRHPAAPARQHAALPGRPDRAVDGTRSVPAGGQARLLPGPADELSRTGEADEARHVGSPPLCEKFHPPSWPGHSIGAGMRPPLMGSMAC
ncbi:putative LigA [Streptomyces misionensis JCM 4497]